MTPGYSNGGQTSYLETMTPYLAGALADGSQDRYAVSAVSEEASAEMPFGAMIARGAGTDGALLPSASALDFLGVLMHSHAYDPYREVGDTGVKPKVDLSILRRGRIAVNVENACNPGDALCVRVAGTGQKGAFRKTPVTSETTIAIPGLKVVVGTSGAGIAVIEFDVLMFGTLTVAS